MIDTTQIKGSPYNKDNPIRKIDSISYVYDYTKGDNITGAYCGPACVAMLTGVDFDEIIELMKGERATKAVLKKALDYYGIRYAPKSTKYNPDIPLPDICIIRMMIANTGIGHWGIFFKGKYYDPDWGIQDKCPPGLKIFQVWEIYP